MTIYERVIHAQKSDLLHGCRRARNRNRSSGTADNRSPEVVEPACSNLIRSLDERRRRWRAAVSGASLARGLRRLRAFPGTGNAAHSRLLALLNSDPHVAHALLDIFEHSPYFAEEFIRNRS